MTCSACPAIPWRALALGVCVTTGGTGCPSMECDGDADWEVIDDDSIRLDPPTSRIDYIIRLTITDEGAASELADELRVGAWLDCFAWEGADGGTLPIDVGLSHADGSGAVVGRGGARLENPLEACGPGPCTRELRAWIATPELSSTAILNVYSGLYTLSTDPESCFIRTDGWVRSFAERVPP